MVILCFLDLVINPHFARALRAGGSVARRAHEIGCAKVLDLSGKRYVSEVSFSFGWSKSPYPVSPYARCKLVPSSLVLLGISASWFVHVLEMQGITFQYFQLIFVVQHFGQVWPLQAPAPGCEGLWVKPRHESPRQMSFGGVLHFPAKTGR